MNRAREKLVTLAKSLGVELRQSHARVGKFALIMHQRYAHAGRFKREALRKLKTYLGRVIRDITRKIEGDHNPFLNAIRIFHGRSLTRRRVARHLGRNPNEDFTKPAWFASVE